MTPEDMAKHVVEICRAFKIELVIDEAMPMERARAMNWVTLSGRITRRRLVISTITNDCEYAVVLHELGHSLAPDGRGVGPHEHEKRTLEGQRKVLSAEAEAWHWARLNARDWTLGMEQTRRLSIRRYVNEFQRWFPKEKL